jgi:hypothetical protein
LNDKEQEAAREREHMYRCLVREVITMRLKDRDGAYRWLRGYSDASGRWKKGWNELHPESNLEKDVRDQWSKGNRGNKGEWK